jgi:3-oxoacyl-[acyl-carrier protein] reductase
MATYASRPFRTATDVKLAKLDLLASNSFKKFTDEELQSFGKPDAAVMLAAILPGLSLKDYNSELMEQVMAVNFTAQARLTQLLLPRLAKGGQILFMSSISGQEGSFDPLYAASKAAIIGFMKSLAKWHGNQVRFNCLAPGLVENSTMYRTMKPERRAHHIKNSPTGALLRLEDLAEVIVDLCQPHWRHLNGQVIGLNGGRYV